MPGLRILCVHNDAGFASKGVMPLQDAGYLMTTVPTGEDAELEFTSQNFQVVVIGPGIFHFAKERLAVKAWEHGCAVIVICSDAADACIMGDAHVDVKDNGTELVRAVAKAVTAKFFAVAA